MRAELDLREMVVIIFETVPAELGPTFGALDVGTASTFINNSLTERTRLACDYLV